MKFLPCRIRSIFSGFRFSVKLQFNLVKYSVQNTQPSRFWPTLSQPIIGLSPMDGVTDNAYRTIQKKYGRPDIVYTEFTSVEGLCNNAVKLMRAFDFDDSQRPIIAQIFGVTPEYFRQVAVMLCELGFDGVDINMGCPAKKVHRHGSGAGLILTPDLAQAIIRQTKQGITDYQNGMRSKDCPDFSERILKDVERRVSQLPQPVDPGRPLSLSLKTRVGYNEPITREWFKYLLETEVETIALHGRTLKQQYSGLANWEEIGKAVELAKPTGKLILGNGDIPDRAEALARCRDYGVNGVLIGRATFGNPFVFLKEGEQPSASIFEVALEHCRLHEQDWPNTPEQNNFFIMRKHLGWYIKSFPDAGEVRRELFSSNSSQEVEAIFRKFGLI